MSSANSSKALSCSRNKKFNGFGSPGQGPKNRLYKNKSEKYYEKYPKYSKSKNERHESSIARNEFFSKDVPNSNDQNHADISN